jgi:putative ABC transport system permease protein
MLAESALCSLAGGLAGVGVAALAVFPFATLIETRLGLPYLTPPAGVILALGAGTVLATLVVGALAGAWPAWRLSRTDAGITLREGA